MDRRALQVEKVKQTQPRERGRGEHRLPWGKTAPMDLRDVRPVRVQRKRGGSGTLCGEGGATPGEGPVQSDK